MQTTLFLQSRQCNLTQLTKQGKNVFAGLYKHSLEWLAFVSGEAFKASFGS